AALRGADRLGERPPAEPRRPPPGGRDAAGRPCAAALRPRRALARAGLLARTRAPAPGRARARPPARARRRPARRGDGRDEPRGGRARARDADRAEAPRRLVGRRRRARPARDRRPGRPDRGPRPRPQDRRRPARRRARRSARDRVLPRRGSGALTAILTLSDVHAGYGGMSILRGVTIEVGEREIVAVLGANGAGKTTLL